VSRVLDKAQQQVDDAKRTIAQIEFCLKMWSVEDAIRKEAHEFKKEVQKRIRWK
jgi:hypothetical protein